MKIPALLLFVPFFALAQTPDPVAAEPPAPGDVTVLCEDGFCRLVDADGNPVIPGSAADFSTNALATVAPEPATPNPEPGTLPSQPATDFSDVRIARTLLGAVSKDEYLDFLAGREPAPSLLDRARIHGGPVLIVLALLLGGFLLNFTPCVLPLIPVNLALLGAGVGSASRRRGFALGGAFGLGITLAFGALGLVSALTGKAFGLLHASVYFNAGVAIVFGLLALAMLDVLHLDFTRFRKRRAAAPEEPRHGLAGALAKAFLAGGGSAFLSSACVAPVLVSALVLSADLVRRGHAAGALVPFVLGLGMALPWPFLGGGLAALPKPGAWMVRVRQLFAAVFLLAAVIFLIQAYRLLFPFVPTPSERGTIIWWTDPHAATLVARATGKPVLVNLTADWCTACHEMDRSTLAEADVAKAAGAFEALRIDCTDPEGPVAAEILSLLKPTGFPYSAILEFPEQP